MGVCKANIDLENLFGAKETLDLNKIKDSVFIAPNNVAFLKKPIREGIIPQILLEFLCSRIMIKKSSKLVFMNVSIRKFLKIYSMGIKNT